MEDGRIPQHLSADSRAWMVEILEVFSFAQAEIKLLIEAAECLDRLAAIRGILRTAGVFVYDRYGNVKPHPMLRAEHDTTNRLQSLCKTLGIVDKNGAKSE